MIYAVLADARCRSRLTLPLALIRAPPAEPMSIRHSPFSRKFSKLLPSALSPSPSPSHRSTPTPTPPAESRGLRRGPAGMPGNQRCDPLGSATGCLPLPLVGDTAGGLIATYRTHELLLGAYRLNRRSQLRQTSLAILLLLKNCP
jgi:hypothetical protein